MNLKSKTLADQKKRLNQRADWFLETGSQEEADQFRAEYKVELAKLNSEIAKCELNKSELLKKAEMLKRDEFNWKEVGKRCESILRLIQDKDAVALKNAYRLLFDAIIVGDLDSDGNTELYFFLKGDDDGPFSGNGNRRKQIRVGIEMAREED